MGFGGGGGGLKKGIRPLPVPTPTPVLQTLRDVRGVQAAPETAPGSSFFVTKRSPKVRSRNAVVLYRRTMNIQSYSVDQSQEPVASGALP